jgi:hypothetical protein
LLRCLNRILISNFEFLGWINLDGFANLLATNWRDVHLTTTTTFEYLVRVSS